MGLEQFDQTLNIFWRETHTELNLPEEGEVTN